MTPSELDEKFPVRPEHCDAIARMKQSATNLPNNPNFVYESDEAALEDFLTIHWAWVTE